MSAPSSENKLLLREPRVFWNDQSVHLTPSQFKVVLCLAAHAGTYVQLRELYDSFRSAGFHAGDGENGFRTNLRATIKRIRQRFRQVDDFFDQIETVIGYGYRWRDASNIIIVQRPQATPRI